MKTLDKAPIKAGTKVLVRGDLDVPLENGKILETKRLDNMEKTLNHIIQAGGIPVIMGHIGRPKGEHVAKLSTKHLLPYFDKHLGKNNYELLENTRFDPREKQNDPTYAEELSKNGDLYVNECFSTSHREHTSTVAITKYLPSYAGYRLKKEIQVLQGVLKDPQKPMALVIGGAKIEDKKPVINNFLDIADYILLGGKVGLEWGDTLIENVHTPIDYAKDTLDIGPKTIAKYAKILAQAKTVVWAGPMGKYEEDDYIQGTKGLANSLKKVKERGGLVIVGGGDTVAAINKVGLLNNINFVSSGGGAMLEFLSKGTLPAIEALK
jgi:phosphoglycerate kinase